MGLPKRRISTQRDDMTMNGRPSESSYDSAVIGRNAAREADRRQFWFRPCIAYEEEPGRRAKASTWTSMPGTTNWQATVVRAGYGGEKYWR